MRRRARLRPAEIGGAIGGMTLSAPINFAGWIDEHRHLLRPPVGNCEVYPHHEFIIMVVGGPNARDDFHVDPGEEFFYMVEGDMVLRVVDDGKLRDIPIKQGEIFLLPANVPHSPQRAANTVGLVVERKRKEGELDAFRWYCAQCSTQMYEEQLQMTDIVAQLPPIFARFYGDAAKRTCPACSWVMPPRGVK
jgi:3-hydroxyanthranilate 3,4-dioxygenase